MNELAADGIPVAVTAGVLQLARQPYYRWLANPIADAELVEAYRANALFGGHKVDPEFGYRYLVEEGRDAGEPMAERTAWRICSEHRLWSVFGKKRGRNGKPGPPVHDDLVEREVTADAPNQLWLTDITEHWTPWIPAVVATPTGGGGDAWSGVLQGAEGKVLQADRQGRDRSGGREGCRRAPGRGLHVAAERRVDDAKGNSACVLRGGESAVRLLAERKNVSAVARGLGFTRVTCYAWGRARPESSPARPGR